MARRWSLEETVQDWIGQVLLAEWDPIGVRDYAQCRDEYDSYAIGVFRVLAHGGTVAEVAEFLLDSEVTYMGLRAQPGRIRTHVAEKAHEFYHAVFPGTQEKCPQPDER